MPIIAFDPGETTGVCIMLDNGEVQYFGQIKKAGLTTFLKSVNPASIDTVVVENYTIFRHKAKQQIGSNVPAAQVIGRIDTWAELNDLPVVKQSANILPMAQKKTQVKMPTDHSASHQVSAFLHGAWYLMERGTMLSALQKASLDKTQSG